MKRTIYDEEHEAFRDTVRGYIESELVPNAEKWEAERIVDRSAYVAAGKHGLIGFNTVSYTHLTLPTTPYV